jgi:hypothetical protein
MGSPSQGAITRSFEKAIRLGSIEQNGQLIAPQYSYEYANARCLGDFLQVLADSGVAIKSLWPKRAWR